MYQTKGKDRMGVLKIQVCLWLLMLGSTALAQPRFRQSESTWVPIDKSHGAYLPAFDTLRTLLITVEYKDEKTQADHWPIGSIEAPAFARKMFAPSLDEMDERSLTAYFLEASLGRFVFLGDCFPQVVHVDSSLDYYQTHGQSEQMVYDVLDKVNRSGLVDWKRYDQWGKRSGVWVKQPDGVIDNIIVLFRDDASIVPPGYFWTGTGGGIAALLCRDYRISESLRISGASMGSGLVVHLGRDYQPRVVKLVKHELAHFFTVNHYGGLNGFYGTDFTLHGAWGLAAAHGSGSICVNAWDRTQMGWTQYSCDLDARTAHDTVIELQDFVTTGESARIRLPYVRDEYFLLEYHANKAWFDRVDGSSNGLFILHQSGEAENHLDCEEADGRWDFVLSDSLTAFEPCCGNQPMVKRLDENPLLGFGDRDDIRVLKNKEDKIITHQNLQRALGFAIEGEQHIIHCDSDGFDGFTTERGRNEFGINTNPATASNGIRNGQLVSQLNGIRIKVIQMDANKVRVKLSFADFHIKHNTRWTGTVHLHDSLLIDPEKELLLNQSRVFNKFNAGLPQTIFTVMDGGSITVGKRARLVLDEKSTLVLQGHAKIYLQKRAKLIIRNESRLIGDESLVVKGKRARIINHKR